MCDYKRVKLNIILYKLYACFVVLGEERGGEGVVGVIR